MNGDQLEVVFSIFDFAIETHYAFETILMCCFHFIAYASGKQMSIHHTLAVVVFMCAEKSGSGMIRA